ncbi:hypothetical protein D9V41_04855 [Aeromicrobium phragmitis]|uniref:Uncharacterized protein n=1 Tax=Aeromicrobium phragmitis TaxID=2478914 RepID=A0A3L8PLZ8_9ACTN|nr:hypothetical protein [Aeromicrobium phragmitis]RLV56416.1 hypothetical protein D9V41_04855 [Aeromicrobium phragmitis]
MSRHAAHARARGRPARPWRAGILVLVLGAALTGCAGSPSSPSGYREATALMLTYATSEVGTSELAWQQHQEGQAPKPYLDVVLRDAHAGLLSRFDAWQSTTPAAGDVDAAVRIRDLGERSAVLVARTQTCIANAQPCDGLADDLRELREDLDAAATRWRP